MLMKALLIFTGGGLGALARYALAGITHTIYLGTFPLGTLVVNTSGSLLIGLLWGLVEAGHMPSHIRSFLFIGILGGFTTFSTFSLETMSLIRDGSWKFASLNILGNNLLGISMALVGYFAARSIIQIMK